MKPHLPKLTAAGKIMVLLTLAAVAAYLITGSIGALLALIAVVVLWLMIAVSVLMGRGPDEPIFGNPPATTNWLPDPPSGP